MMCVLGLMVRKERIVVMTSDSLLLFVDKRCYVLENQKTLSIELVMSDRVTIDDYELLEKKSEGYEQESKQLVIENGLMNIKHAIELQMRLY